MPPADPRRGHPIRGALFEKTAPGPRKNFLLKNLRAFVRAFFRVHPWLKLKLQKIKKRVDKLTFLFYHLRILKK
jgi:hypothetical protein